MRASAHVEEWRETANQVRRQRKAVEAAVHERVERALTLECTRHPHLEDVYHVTGGKDPDGHTVDLRAEWKSQCTCGSHMWRDDFCKHLMRVNLERGAFLADTWPEGTYRPGIISRAVQVDLENAARRAAEREAAQ
jgi:hypothetical protein